MDWAAAEDAFESAPADPRLAAAGGGLPLMARPARALPAPVAQGSSARGLEQEVWAAGPPADAARGFASRQGGAADPPAGAAADEDDVDDGGNAGMDDAAAGGGVVDDEVGDDEDDAEAGTGLGGCQRKRACAIYMAFCGTGYFGMQM